MQCFKPAPASAAGTWGPGQQPVMALLCRPCAGRDCVTRSQSSAYSKGLGNENSWRCQQWLAEEA